VHFRGYCAEKRAEHTLVTPKRGRAVFWRSFAPTASEGGRRGKGGYFIANSTHGACPVVRGEKWVLQQWITKHLTNVIRHPRLLMHLPLGSAGAFNASRPLQDDAGLLADAELARGERYDVPGVSKHTNASRLRGRCAALRPGRRLKIPRGGALGGGGYSMAVWFKVRKLPAGGGGDGGAGGAGRAGLLRTGSRSADHQLSVDGRGKLHWSINGEPIPNGDHFPDARVPVGAWFQLLLTSGLEPDGGARKQVTRVLINPLRAGSFGNLKQDPFRELGRVEGPPLAEALSLERTAIGGCGAAAAGGGGAGAPVPEALVDMAVQDAVVLGTVLGREARGLLVRSVYQYDLGPVEPDLE
jgi:hypothetical protein